jgi:hypothetical protein
MLTNSLARPGAQLATMLQLTGTVFDLDNYIRRRPQVTQLQGATALFKRWIAGPAALLMAIA